MHNQLFHQCCIKGTIEHIPNDAVDLIIADPPYNLSFSGTTQTKNKKPRFNIFPNDRLTPQEYRRFCLQWLFEAYRILKPGRHLYVCIDWRKYPDMVRWMRAIGFIVKNCLVWDKVNMGLGWQYRFQHEFVILAVKGEKRVRRVKSRKASDLVRIPRIPGNQTIHPTEKPLELMEHLIENSSDEGELVVDFFSGSGVVSAAAIKTGRDWTAFEIDADWYQKSMERIKSYLL